MALAAEESTNMFIPFVDTNSIPRRGDQSERSSNLSALFGVRSFGKLSFEVLSYCCGSSKMLHSSPAATLGAPNVVTWLTYRVEDSDVVSGSEVETSREILDFRVHLSFSKRKMCLNSHSFDVLY